MTGHKGQSLNAGFLFLIGIFTFIEAYTKLHMAFSAAANLGLANAKHGVVVVFFHKKLFEVRHNVRRDLYFQHG